MLKLMLAASALTLMATAAQAQDADWSGPYVGVIAGTVDRSDSGGETISFDTNLDNGYGDTVKTAAGANAFSPGFCGGANLTNAAAGGCRGDDDNSNEFGVRAGYDLQYGSWLVGGLAEYSSLQLQDSVTAFSVTPAAYTFTRKLTSLTAVRARGGYVFGDNLVYATGGYARGAMRHSFNTTNTVNTFPQTGGGDANGYQVGLGYERKVMANVTLGVEWIRTRLDDDDYGVRATGPAPATNPFILANPGGTNFQRTDDKFEFDSYRVTASYRF